MGLPLVALSCEAGKVSFCPAVSVSGIENLPCELQRNFQLMRELDQRTEGGCRPFSAARVGRAAPQGRTLGVVLRFQVPGAEVLQAWGDVSECQVCAIKLSAWCSCVSSL